MSNSLAEKIYPVPQPGRHASQHSAMRRLPQRRGASSMSSRKLWHRVYAATRRIPQGRVATYADIARAIGRPRAWRHVGTVLSLNRDPKTPCHRVVRSDGAVGGFGFPGGTRRKIARLSAEGITVINDKINLARYRISSPRVIGIVQP